MPDLHVLGNLQLVIQDYKNFKCILIFAYEIKKEIKHSHAWKGTEY